MSGFRFQDPGFLLLLIPLLSLGVWASRRRDASVLYSDVSLLRTLPETLAQRLKRLLPWVRLGGLAMALVALCARSRVW